MNLKLIQSFRGFAAMAVVAFHTSIGMADPRYFGQPVLAWFTWKLNLGVDFFFVLSGFIIALAHSNDLGQPQQIMGYFKKRLIRIYPIYWVYLTVFCALALAGFSTKATLPTNPVQWLTTYSLVRFANIDLPINPAWTLFHEVLFYAIFGFLILEKRIGILIFIAWQVTCLALLHYQGPADRTFFTTLFSAYNLDFSIGIAAFFAFRNLAIIGWKFAGTMGAVIFIITLALESNGIASTINPLIYAISFGFAVLAAAKYEANAVPLNLGLLPLLGNASYSIYLTHTALVGLFQKITIKLLSFIGIIQFNAMVLHISYGVILVSTITAGTLAYLLIEQPLLKVMRKSNSFTSI